MHIYTHTYTLIENKMNLGRVSIHILYVFATVDLELFFKNDDTDSLYTVDSYCRSVSDITPTTILSNLSSHLP